MALWKKYARYLWRHFVVKLLIFCLLPVVCYGEELIKLHKIDYSLESRNVGLLTLSFSRMPDIEIDKQAQKLTIYMSNTVSQGVSSPIDLRDFATPVSYLELTPMKQQDDLLLTLYHQDDYEYVVRRQNNSIVLRIKGLRYGQDKPVKVHDVIDVNLQNVPLNQALITLAQMANVDLIINDSLSQSVSMQLNDIAWQSAWQALLNMHGLQARRDGDVFWVTRDGQRPRGNGEDGELSGNISPLVTRQFKLHYADAKQIAAVIEKQLPPVLSKLDDRVKGNQSIDRQQWRQYSLLSDKGRVSVDQRTNSLLVKESPDLMPQVIRLVKKLDVPVPQVEIEMRIVQVQEDAGKDLGVRLGFALSSVQQSGSPVYIGQAGQLSASRQLQNDQLNEVLPLPNNEFLSVNLPASGFGAAGAASYALSLYNPGMHWLRALDLELSAMQIEGRGSVLAKPKILTLDKQRATIEQGQERLAVIESDDSAQSQTQKAVLKLSVLPHITPDQYIVLDVEISNDNFVDALAGLISTNRIETRVRLHHGETMMVGGIYTSAEANQIAKVPWFGDLPWIGNAFKRRSNLSQRAELLVFLTPRILPLSPKAKICYKKSIASENSCNHNDLLDMPSTP